MSLTKIDNTDDSIFLEQINGIMSGIAKYSHPENVLIFRINNWFSSKWLAFSGKLLGALGVWSGSELVVPPFVENRITAQSAFKWDEGTHFYQYVGTGQKIHFKGPSVKNLQRRVKKIVPDTALFWYSGNTSINQRGCLMGYIPVAQEQKYWGWYLSFKLNSKWKIISKINFPDKELHSFKECKERFSCS